MENISSNLGTLSGFVILVRDILQGKKIPANKICFIERVNIKGRAETVA
jgi:hypothetical protein